MGAVERIFKEEFAVAEERALNRGIDRGINIGRAEERKLIRERLIESGMSPQEADKFTE